MRTMLAALLGIALMAASAPAFAHVVEVTTAVSLADVERLYVRLLMADAEGEEMLRDLAPDGPPSGTDDGAPAEHTYSKEPI